MDIEHYKHLLNMIETFDFIVHPAGFEPALGFPNPDLSRTP